MIADRALLERILEEGRVDTSVEVPPWAAWAGEALVAVLERFVSGVGRALPSLPPSVAAILGWALVALLAAAVALLAARWLGASARRKRPAARAEVAPIAPQRTAAPVDWRAEARARLAAGRVDEALEAAWWWFATRLCGGPVDSAWTTREVLVRARRPDLEPLGRALDVWLYGRRRPGADDVAALLAAIECAQA